MSDSRVENQLDDIIEELGGEPSGGSALSRVESKLNDILALIEGGGGGSNISLLQGDFEIGTGEFTADDTYTDFPFRYAIDVPGCTPEHFADISVDVDTATSGNIAPVCNTHNGRIYIYSKQQSDAVITGTYSAIMEVEE